MSYFFLHTLHSVFVAFVHLHPFFHLSSFLPYMFLTQDFFPFIVHS